MVKFDNNLSNTTETQPSDVLNLKESLIGERGVPNESLTLSSNPQANALLQKIAAGSPGVRAVEVLENLHKTNPSYSAKNLKEDLETLASIRYINAGSARIDHLANHAASRPTTPPYQDFHTEQLTTMSDHLNSLPSNTPPVQSLAKNLWQRINTMRDNLLGADKG
jgi:hypothetical protein